jgi:hypothetical protein
VPRARRKPGQAPWVLGALAVLFTAPRVGAERGQGEPLVLPRMNLSVDPADPKSWVIRLENDDMVPVRILEDWRLLSFDVTPPAPGRGRAVTQHCALPPEMRPDTDEARHLILPPHRTYVAMIDPRAFCFGGAKERAMVAGASVVAHFGFAPDRRPTSPPLFMAPVDIPPDRAGGKEVVSEPFNLPERPPPPEPDASGENPTVTVSSPTRIDVANVRDLSVTVTVTNRTPRRLTLMLNPGTVAIEATNHQGNTIRCQWPNAMSPIAELFTTIPPLGHASTEVLVSDLCAPQFFGRPGLYSVRATVDTRQVSGEAIGIHSFEGEATASEPSLVRIRTPMRGLTRPE